jgi:hypothetical protein
MTRRLLLAALVSAAAITPALGQATPTPPDNVPGVPDSSKVYGPSWQAFTRPGPNTRPEKLDEDVIVGVVDKTGNDMAVQVSFWADVADLKKGDKYELRYQLRVHTAKGEMGPLLGDAAHPNGVAFTLATATAGDDWRGVEGTVDVTRKDLSAATNLPRPPKGKGRHTVLLRVEPQVYDATTGKYLTPGKTEAVVLAAEVTAGGKVWEVRTLGQWLAMNRGNTADDALALLATLDEYDPTASGVEAGIEQVLGMADVKAETKAKFVAAIPAGRLYWKPSYALKEAVEKFADGPDGVLKAAAKKKLEEANKAIERR